MGRFPLSQLVGARMAMYTEEEPSRAAVSIAWADQRKATLRAPNNFMMEQSLHLVHFNLNPTV